MAKEDKMKLDFKISSWEIPQKRRADIAIGLGMLLFLGALSWYTAQEYKTKLKLFPDAKIVTELKDFKVKDALKFRVHLGKKNIFANGQFTAVDKVIAQQNGTYSEGNVLISAAVINKTIKSEVVIPLNITKVAEDTLEVEAFPENNSLKPGTYQLQVTIAQGNSSQVITQDFSWGVLAVNTNKSIYAPNEQATISFGVLNDTGETVCGAKLSVSIRGPQGAITRLATSDSSIATNPLCKDKEYTLVPDYKALFTTQGPGKYEIQVNALTANGEYLIVDSFEVRGQVSFDVERITATRINPIYPYPVIFKMTAHEDYTGWIQEQVPAGFTITETAISTVLNVLQGYSGDYINTKPTTETINNVTYVKWPVNLTKGKNYTFSYTYEAPHISPEFYLLGPLNIGEFTETRQWQLAADAVANMVLLWDNGATSAPAGWLCISCETTDPFYGRYVRGASTYADTGGSASHSHAINTGSSTAANNDGGATSNNNTAGYPALAGHTHPPGTATGNTALNQPAFRNLNLIKYLNGVPSSLPAGVIGIFDSSTAPPGWTQLNGATNYEDGKYIVGGGSPTVGTTGGNNSHTHTVTVTTGQAETSPTRARTGTSEYVGAQNHTHTSAATASDSNNREPPYITVMLAKKDGAGPAPVGIISMFDATPAAAQWEARSASAADPFYEKFFKPTGTYGTTAPANTHSHANLTNVASGIADQNIRINSTGTTFSESDAGGLEHGHTLSAVSFGIATDYLPEYTNVIFSKALEVAGDTSYRMVGGTVYIELTTVATTGNGGSCDGTTANITFVLDSTIAGTTSCNGTNATFNMKLAGTSPGFVTIFSTAANKATRFFRSAGGNETTKHLRYNKAIIGQGGSYSNADLEIYDNDQNTDMLYDSDSNHLTVEADRGFTIDTSAIYTPGGTLNMDCSTCTAQLETLAGAHIYFDQATSQINTPVTLESFSYMHINANTIFRRDINAKTSSNILYEGAPKTMIMQSPSGTIYGAGLINLPNVLISSTSPSDNNTYLSNPVTINGNLTTSGLVSNPATLVTNSAVSVGGNIEIGQYSTLSASTNSANNLTVHGNFVNTQGTFTEGTNKLIFAGTGPSNISVTCTDVANCTAADFYNIQVNKTAADTVSRTVTLGSNLAVNNGLVLTKGRFSNSGYNSRLAGSVGLAVYHDAEYIQTSSVPSTLYLGGNVENWGRIDVSGNTSACGEADNLTITSTNTTPRNWTNYSPYVFIEDVTVSYMTGSSPITAYSSTNGGNMGANWQFIDQCLPENNNINIQGGSGLNFDGITFQ